MKKFKEFAASADKKPENYRDPETGTTKTRMVPVEKKIVKTNEKKHKQLDELSPDLLNRAAKKAGQQSSSHFQQMKRAKTQKTAAKQAAQGNKRSVQSYKFKQATKGLNRTGTDRMTSGRQKPSIS